MRRAAVGGGLLVVPASGLSAFAGAASAATLPDADLAYLRLLIAAELLAIDFQTQALRSGKLRHPATRLMRQIRADENAHYITLSDLMAAEDQTPTTAGDINFSYPKGSFGSQASVLKLARRLEHLLVGAYLGAVVNVESPQLRLPIGQIAANEAQHSGALAGLEGRSVVGRALAEPWPMVAVSDALDRFES